MSKKKNKKADQATSKSEVNFDSIVKGLDTALDAAMAFDENDPELMKFSEATESSESSEGIEFQGVEEESEFVADIEGDDVDAEAAAGSELENFESADVEEIGTLSDEQITSVVESLLFSTEKPMSAASMKAAFAGYKVRVPDIRKAVERLQMEYASPARGVTVEEVAGGYQLRTKPENMTYLRQTIKNRPFKLSGPALEVLAVVAYKQPCTKSAVDEIRGVESGHLMRGLLERGIIRFFGKSELPGRPMLYETTRKFLETFGLRNINELPSINEIEQILPEGIDETTAPEKETLGDLTGRLSETVGTTYSQGEEELGKISDELSAINTSSEFFENEKQRMKDKAEAEKARDIRERMMVGEEVSTRDRNWLTRYDEALAAAAVGTPGPAVEESAPAEGSIQADETP